MSTPKRGLGRGLKVLMQPAVSPPTVSRPDQSASPPGSRPVLRIPLDRIQPSPWQPRRQFDAEALAELAASIRERGVLQPLLVRRSGDHYEVIAGERRWRAAREAGLTDVPAILLDAADQDALEVALVENVQREDLNPIEEAEAYRALSEKFGLTQEAIAARTGRARASVANALRLLQLSSSIRQWVAEGVLSAGHAKVLLSVEDPDRREALAQQAVSHGWSVRELEQRAARPARTPRSPKARSAVPLHPQMAHLAETLQRHFGTQVRIVPQGGGDGAGGTARGRIEIEYYSADDFNRILALMGVSDREEMDLSRL